MSLPASFCEAPPSMCASSRMCSICSHHRSLLRGLTVNLTPFSPGWTCDKQPHVDVRGTWPLPSLPVCPKFQDICRNPTCFRIWRFLQAVCAPMWRMPPFHVPWFLVSRHRNNHQHSGRGVDGAPPSLCLAASRQSCPRLQHLPWLRRAFRDETRTSVRLRGHMPRLQHTQGQFAASSQATVHFTGGQFVTLFYRDPSEGAVNICLPQPRNLVKHLIV